MVCLGVWTVGFIPVCHIRPTIDGVRATGIGAMGQIFGYEGRIHEGMQLAIRKEAAQIFLGGSYLKAPSRWAPWTGKEALSKVCETIHQHRQERTMHELFRKTAEALPLKYPLGGDTLALCDLRGCRTVADVSCIFLQRIVAEHLLREADRRLWSVARKQHGAVTPLCWGLSYVTCTCCCVGQYEQMVKFPLGGCACSPKHTSPSRTDLAKADLKAAKQGVAALSALSVACHFRQSLRKLSLAFAEEEVHVAQMSLGVPGSGGSDRPWNWPEMKAMLGLRKRYQRRMEEREEELRERELQSHPLSEFRVVNAGAISSHKLVGDVPLTVGDVVLPIELHPGLWLEMTTGATCPMISQEQGKDEMLLRPTSNYWVARETMPIYPHPVDSDDEEDSGTQVDSETTFVFKPVQQEMLERGDLVRSSEAKLYPEFVAVEEKASDFIHIRTLDGKLIFTVSSEDDLLDFPLKTLKRKVFEHLKLSELVQLELVCASGGLEDSEKLSALKGQGSPGPIEFFVTVTLERGQGGTDAYELTRILSANKTYAEDFDPKVTAEALQNFYKSRMPRVAGISLLSGLASDLIINAFGTPWSPHDDKGTDWRSYLTKPFLQFIFFPLQFLFLYSNHPSGGMGDLPQRMKEEWEKRHKKSAEAAFAAKRLGKPTRHFGGKEEVCHQPSFFAKVNAVEGDAVEDTVAEKVPA
eukprot:s276_g18.t1